jgi:hypothetical protein
LIAFHQHNDTTVFISGNKPDDEGSNYGPYIPFLPDDPSYSFMRMTTRRFTLAARQRAPTPAMFDLNASADVTGVSIDKRMALLRKHSNSSNRLVFEVPFPESRRP